MFCNLNRRIGVSAVLVSVLALAGCTGETDPAKAGLFDTIRNVETGEYDRQIAQGKSEAARIIADNRRQEASIANLSNQKRANTATSNRLRSQIASVQAQLSAAKAKVAGDPAKLARLNQLGRQLASVRAASQAGGSSSALSAEVASVKRAIRLLAS
jgi:hypothetical protein